MAKMAHQVTRRAGLLAALGMTLLAACRAHEGVPVHEDAELSAKIQQVQLNGGSVRLRDLTGGDWDTVFIFPDPVSRRLVEQTIGAPIDMGHVASGGHVLVFTKAGLVQRATFTMPDNLIHGTFSDRVLLRARPEPGSTVLEVVEGP